MFSEVWSENAALFEIFMEIHSHPQTLYYGFSLFPRYPLQYNVKVASANLLPIAVHNDSQDDGCQEEYTGKQEDAEVEEVPPAGVKCWDH